MKNFTLVIILATTCFKTNAQNVGIGTPSPAQKLEVVGNIGLRTAATWDHMFFSHDGETASINAGGADKGLSFNVGNSAFGTYGEQLYNNAMRILANGNVGIGTTTPAAKLDVNGTFKLGTTNSTTLSGFGQASGNFSGGTIPANSSAAFSISVGLTTNAAIMFNPGIDLPDGIILTYIRGSNSGTIFGKLYNVKSTAVVVPDFIATVTWIKQ